MLDREKLKLLIELSPTPQEADRVIVSAGFTDVYEKTELLNELFAIRLIGFRHEIVGESKADLEMDYFAVLHSIVFCR